MCVARTSFTTEHSQVRCHYHQWKQTYRWVRSCHYFLRYCTFIALWWNPSQQYRCISDKDGARLVWVCLCVMRMQSSYATALRTLWGPIPRGLVLSTPAVSKATAESASQFLWRLKSRLGARRFSQRVIYSCTSTSSYLPISRITFALATKKTLMYNVGNVLTLPPYQGTDRDTIWIGMTCSVYKWKQ